MGCATQRRLKRHQSPMQPLWEGKTLSSVLPVTFNGCKTGRDAACGGLKREREREREREGEREATTLLGCWLRFDRRRRKKPQCALSLSLFSLFLSLARSLAGFSYFLSRSSGTNEKLHVRMFFLSLYGWLVGWLVVCVSVCALRRRRNSSATSTLRFACLPACLPFCRRS